MAQNTQLIVVSSVKIGGDSDCVDLVVTTEETKEATPEETSAYEERIAEIRRERDIATRHLTSIVARINKMTAEVREDAFDSFQELSDLHKEIADLNAEYEEKVRKLHSGEGSKAEEEDLDAAFESFDNRSSYQQYSHQSSTEEEEVAFSKKDKRVKTLFRKIAAKTHPDKNPDPEKHKLFVSARQYYHNNDYEGLKSIWDTLQGQRSSLLNKLLRALQEELASLAQVKLQLDALLSSDDHDLLLLYEKNKYQVLHAIRQKNAMQRQLLIMHRDRLKAQLGYTKPQESYIYFQFG